ncbi:MAG: hypothetical protein LBF15_03190 [Candidatus Peribacteria bacterium]|jgi:hypothetical protein|nr:hypothetical protein [Candidatus Peribacteria bacterium]
MNAATNFNIKSLSHTLFESLFHVSETIKDVKFVQILAQITRAKAFSYAICHVTNAVKTSIIVA